MAGNRETYEEAMNAGHNAAWDQDWSLAVKSYGRAIQEIPEDPEAHILLGLALLETGRLDEALRVYTRAHQLSPEDPIPLEKSADVLERLGRLREAAQQYIKVADIYFGQRDLDKTIGNWERATRLTPGLIPIHAKLAQLRERIGDRKGAIREYLTLSFNFQSQGSTDKAMKAAQRALRLDKNNTQVMNTIRALESGMDILPPEEEEVAPQAEPEEDEFDIFGNEFAARGRDAQLVGAADPRGPIGEAMSEALEMLATFVVESGSLDDSGASVLQAMEFQRQEMYNEAIAAYQQAAGRLNHPALKLNLGALLTLADQPQEATRHLGEASMHPELGAGALHALGQAYNKMGQYKKAARFLIQAVQTVDTNLAVDETEASELGSVYERLLNTLEELTDEYLAAMDKRFLQMLEGVEWKQRIAETRRQLEEIMRGQGERGAVDILVDARGDELNNSIARIRKFTGQGFLTLAMDEAHRAIELSPGYLPVHINMAEIMMREGRVRGAINKYNVVAQTYFTRGEHDRAAEILHQVLEMAPLDIDVRMNLINLLETEERWEEVIEQYTSLADAYHQLGNFDMSRSTFNAAERTAQRVGASPQTMAHIKHRMADIDQMRLDLRKAQKTYEEIIQLVSDDEKAHRALVELNFRQGNNIEGIRRLDQLLSIYARQKQIQPIVKLLEDLVKSYPDDTGVRSRLAAIYRQLNRRDEAIAQLDALGDLQLEAGLHKDAANTIRQIIALKPDGIDEYRRLLAQLGG